MFVNLRDLKRADIWGEAEKTVVAYGVVDVLQELNKRIDQSRAIVFTYEFSLLTA